MIVSILVDYGRSKTLYKISRKYGSQALEADALHFKTDMLTSGVVLSRFGYCLSIWNSKC